MSFDVNQTPHPNWVRDLKPYVPDKPIEELERELGISGAVKLASNENPLGPSPLAVEAMAKALSQGHLYPDANSFYLKAKLAKHLDVPAEELVVGNGSNELLTLLVRCFTTPEDHAVISEGSFIAYTVVLNAAGVPTTRVPMRNGFGHDLEAMAAACTDKTRLLFVANPNNPTGTYNSRDEIAALLKAVPPHVLVVLDEAYFEYAWAEDYPDGMGFRHLRENLVVLRTFSKCYGLAGARVGYGVAPPYVADLIQRVREPFSLNILGQVGALAALDDQDFVKKTVELNRLEMKRLVPELNNLGLETFETQCNFLFVHSPLGGPELYDRLLRRGIIVRPLIPYRLADHVRISIGLPAENDRALEALRAVI